MRASTMPWPKLIGAVLGIESAGLVLWQLRSWWWRTYVTPGYVMGVEIFWFVVGLVLCVLTVGIYRGRGWARWAVITVSICFIALMIVLTTIEAVKYWIHISDWAQPMTGEVRAQQILDLAQRYGLVLCFSSPIALLLLLLFRPDVAASFSRRDETI